MPSTSFQPILDAALTDYTKQVAIELANHPLVDTFQFCGSPNDVLKLLDDTINQFGDFRNGNRKLLNWLSPVVHVARTLSAALGASITLVSQDILVLVSFFFTNSVYQVPFGPAKAIFVGVDVLISVRIPLYFATASPSNLRVPQVASGVSSSYDALVDLY